MKNILDYYYSLHPTEISYKENKYFFEYLDVSYVLEEFRRPLTDIDCLYKINKQMLQKQMLVHEILLNNEGKIITFINNTPYVLMEVNINIKIKINLPEICYINNNTFDIECDKLLNRENWSNLWAIKNDYIESQINEVGKKIPELSNCTNYYIGLAENAISYINSIYELAEPTFLCACHKRIKCDESIYDLYNPLSYIYDYRVRDVCEYIKHTFFFGENAYCLVSEYFENNVVSYKEALLFYGRMLYPSYFFDLYDDFVNEKVDINSINNVIQKSQEYEIFLQNINWYIERYYNRYIPQVDWLIKKSYI